MILGGLDIATTTGLALARGTQITVSSYRSRAERPDKANRKGVMDFKYEAKIFRDFRDHLRPWLVENQVEMVAIETPMQPMVGKKKTVVNQNAIFAGQAITEEFEGGTTMNAIFRIYGLFGTAIEVCERLNIPFETVPAATWRKHFINRGRAPSDASNGTAWLKAEAKRRCAQLGIKVSNADQADAAGIVWWLQGHMQEARMGELIAQSSQ